MSFVAVPVRLAHAIKLSSLISHRGPPQPPAHFFSDVPQPSVSLVSAPVLIPDDTYVGLQLIGDSGVTFQWGDKHTIDHIQIGLGQHTSLRLWSELTPFETSIAMEWARDVILEHTIAQWPLFRFGDWWALPSKYHSSGEKMLPESSLMTRQSSERGRALKLAKTISSWAPHRTCITPFLDTVLCTGSASVSGSGTRSDKRVREWRPCDDDDSDRDGITSSGSAPGSPIGSAVVPSPVNTSVLSVLSDFKWGIPFRSGGAIKQACPVPAAPDTSVAVLTADQTALTEGASTLS